MAQWRGGAGALTGALSDINGDGHTDVVARFSDGALWVYPGTGNTGMSTFGDRYQVGTGWNDATSIIAADINGDDHVDVLARFADGTLWVYPGTGKTGMSTFGDRYQVGTGWADATAVAVADLNGDGHLDILARFSDGALWVYPGTGQTGTSTFGERYQVGSGWNDATAIIAADLNGDGHTDVLARFSDGGLWVYPGTGNTGMGTFGDRYQVGTGWNDASALTVGDLNGDGHLDILARFSDGALWVYPGTGKTGLSTFGDRYQVGTGWNDATALT
ncbi:VCBS repeat-containing protein [Actinoplanes sp. NPDC051861]|uniref:VCBS repeat-containing protein n=1 Tax=Actinoplanes sp. NPDC051861 TaxID=3155170 RepID=UPI00343004DF